MSKQPRRPFKVHRGGRDAMTRRIAVTVAALVVALTLTGVRWVAPR